MDTRRISAITNLYVRTDKWPEKVGEQQGEVITPHRITAPGRDNRG